MTEEKKPSKVWLFLHSPVALWWTLGLVVLIFLLVYILYLGPQQSTSEVMIKQKQLENAALDSAIQQKNKYIEIITLSNESLRAAIDRGDHKIKSTNERTQEIINNYRSLGVPELQRIFIERYDSLIKR